MLRIENSDLFIMKFRSFQNYNNNQKKKLEWTFIDYTVRWADNIFIHLLHIHLFSRPEYGYMWMKLLVRSNWCPFLYMFMNLTCIKLCVISLTFFYTAIYNWTPFRKENNKMFLRHLIAVYDWILFRKGERKNISSMTCYMFHL